MAGQDPQEAARIIGLGRRTTESLFRSLTKATVEQLVERGLQQEAVTALLKQYLALARRERDGGHAVLVFAVLKRIVILWPLRAETGADTTPVDSRPVTSLRTPAGTAVQSTIHAGTACPAAGRRRRR